MECTMHDERCLHELAKNVRDLIAEAELLFRNRHWARAAGLAMYAGEEAIKFDSLKNHPETTTHNHASRGKVWNQHDQNAYVSAASQSEYASPRYLARGLEAKAERAKFYREALHEDGRPCRTEIPDFMRDLPSARQRSFYVDVGRDGPSSVTEEQARMWIERANKIAGTTGAMDFHNPRWHP
jgi:AbiV family abortive infection protein